MVCQSRSTTSIGSPTTVSRQPEYDSMSSLPPSCMAYAPALSWKSALSRYALICLTSSLRTRRLEAEPIGGARRRRARAGGEQAIGHSRILQDERDRSVVGQLDLHL